MKASMTMDLRVIEDGWIFEQFNGTPEECYAWGFSKRDEFLDLTGWAYEVNGYTSVVGGTFDLSTISGDSHDFMIFVNRPYKHFMSVHYYGDEE